MSKNIIGNIAIVGFINFVAEDGKRAILGTGTTGEGDSAKPNGVVDDVNSVTLFLKDGVSVTKGQKVRCFGELSVGEYEGKPSLAMNINSPKQAVESTERTGLTLSGFVNYVAGNRLLLGTGGYKKKDSDDRVNFETVTVFIKEGLAVPAKGERLVFRANLKAGEYEGKASYSANLNSDKQLVAVAEAEMAESDI